MHDSSNPIAPVIFKAAPKGDLPGSSDTIECFNAGATEGDLDPLTTPYSVRGEMVAFWTSMLGAVPFAVCVLWAVVAVMFGFVGIIQTDPWWSLPDALIVASFAGFCIFLVGGAWSYWLAAPSSKGVRAWQQAISEALATHGEKIIPFRDIPSAVRDEVEEQICRLHEYRHQFRVLSPAGDELDEARSAIYRYILASDIPLLLRDAAAAPHIRDTAVRKAAKEHARAAQAQAAARRDAVKALERVDDLLTARRLERSDADLIRRANARSGATS